MKRIGPGSKETTDWVGVNKLRLNPNKTKILLVGLNSAVESGYTGVEEGFHAL